MLKLPATEAKTETATKRYVLPKDLHAAVKYLSDGELELLHATTLEEMRRRGKMPRGAETDLQFLCHRFAPPDLIKRQLPPTKTRRNVDIASLTHAAVKYLSDGELELLQFRLSPLRQATLAAWKHRGPPWSKIDQASFPRWGLRPRASAYRDPSFSIQRTETGEFIAAFERSALQ